MNIDPTPDKGDRVMAAPVSGRLEKENQGLLLTQSPKGDSVYAPQSSLNFLFFFFFYFFFSTFIYFWDRERQSMNRGGAERKGDTEFETGSRL